MSEWWTYTLSDFLLFSPRTYYRLFELYNADIWPAQIVTLALGVAAVGLLRHPRAGQGRIVAAILAGCWLWVAWAFHWRHYATINWAATYFAGAFALEALFLIVIGVVRNDLSFGSTSSAPHRIGCAVVLFALAVQPLVGPLVGQGMDASRSVRRGAGSYRGRDAGLSARGPRTHGVDGLADPGPLVRTEWRGPVDDGLAGCVRRAGGCASGGDDCLEGEVSHRVSASVMPRHGHGVMPPFVARRRY